MLLKLRTSTVGVEMFTALPSMVETAVAAEPMLMFSISPMVSISRLVRTCSSRLFSSAI